MVSSDYYRNQARIFLEWAKRSDAMTAAKLRKRAEEYLILAKALDPAAPPPQAEADQPSVQQQQQQQIQPESDPETE